MPIKYTVNTKIRFNGKEYSHVEDMPAEARQAFEQAMARAQQSGSQVQKSSKVVFNGHAYQSVDEMPAEVRQEYDKVMDLVDADHNGIPDMLEKSSDESASTGGFPMPADTLTPSAPLFPTPSDAPKPAQRRMFGTIALFVLALVILGVLVVLSQGGLAFK